MTRAIATLCAVTLILSTGCRKTADNTVNYTAALNQYYAAHPVCLWAEPQRFPVQANTSDTTKTAPFDALVDQGLLARTTAEKKEMIVLSKQVTNYDLSDQGRGAWVADVNQPGFGNFCYGHFSVASIDSAAPTTGQPGATTQVSYRYGISGAPGGKDGIITISLGGELSLWDIGSAGVGFGCGDAERVSWDCAEPGAESDGVGYAVGHGEWVGGDECFGWS